jgi:hypothetical protein
MKRFALVAFAVMAVVGLPTLASAMAMPEPIPITDKMISPADAGEMLMTVQMLDADQAIRSGAAVTPTVWEMPKLFGPSAIVPAYRHIDPGRT